MPGSDIEAFIEELEDLINNAKAPLAGGGSKKIIDADAAYEILDDIKGALPEEFQQARRVLREQKEILASANAEAEHIVKDAQDKAETLASDQEIVRIANNQAEDIRRNAEAEARDTRYWAANSAEKTFATIEEELQAVIDKTNSLLSQITYYRELLSGRNEYNEDDQAPRDEE